MLESDYAVQPEAWSPDGRWIGYVSNKTEADEIYVTAFPEPGSERIVSTESGGGPSWNLDGSGPTYRDDRRFHFVTMDGLRPGERDKFLDAYH